MAGPFQHAYNPERQGLSPGSAASPLSPVPITGQPISFKRNVNRTKTKRWVEARPYSYDGTDWGDSDEYDDNEDPSAASKQTGPKESSQGMRNTSTPTSPGVSDRPMRTSARAETFPAPGHSGSPPSAEQHLPLHSPPRFYARSAENKAVEPAVGSPDGGSAKPPAFVRPADICKRMQEERERERRFESSGRSGFESTGPTQGAGDQSHAAAATQGQPGPEELSSASDRQLPQSLRPGAERQGGSNPENISTGLSTAWQDTPVLGLPEIKRFSGFGTDFTGQAFSEIHNTSTAEGQSQGEPSLQHNPSLGFRSVVHQAFDVPPTPSSTQDSVVRSNSDSTSVISPIVAGRSLSAEKTPTITEEPAELTTASSAADAGAGTLMFKPGHRRDLSIPSPNNSPARKPVVLDNDQLPGADMGEMSSATPSATQQPYRPGESDSTGNQQTRSQKNELSASSAPFGQQGDTDSSGRLEEQHGYVSIPRPLRIPSGQKPSYQASTVGVPEIVQSMDTEKSTSTEASPQDTESDRLRKEIMRSLTPSASPRAEATTIHPSESQRLEPQAHIPRESEAIPSEYHSYWNEQPRASSGPQHPNPPVPESQSVTRTPDAVAPSGEPSSNSSYFKDGPPRLTRRFSWESSSEESEAEVPPPLALQPAQAVQSNVQFPGPSPGNEMQPDAGAKAESADSRYQLSQPVGSENQQSNENMQDGPSTQSQQVQPPAPATHPGVEPKLPGFREILGIKSANERIRVFNETREKFAAIDTGLENWIRLTAEALPEHADLIAQNGKLPAGSHRPSPSRTKFPKFLQASSYHDGSQPSSALGHVRRPSGSLAGMMTMQQVEAKGKDLLHTAGVFGGKAGEAAKELFAKGKSKFRSSADKGSRSFSSSGPGKSSQLAEERPSFASDRDKSNDQSQRRNSSHVGSIPRLPSLKFNGGKFFTFSDATANEEHPQNGSESNSPHSTRDVRSSFVNAPGSGPDETKAVQSTLNLTEPISNEQTSNEDILPEATDHQQLASATHPLPLEDFVRLSHHDSLRHFKHAGNAHGLQNSEEMRIDTSGRHDNFPSPAVQDYSSASPTSVTRASRVVGGDISSNDRVQKNHINGISDSETAAAPSLEAESRVGPPDPTSLSNPEEPATFPPSPLQAFGVANSRKQLMSEGPPSGPSSEQCSGQQEGERVSTRPNDAESSATAHSPDKVNIIQDVPDTSHVQNSQSDTPPVSGIPLVSEARRLESADRTPQECSSKSQTASSQTASSQRSSYIDPASKPTDAKAETGGAELVSRVTTSGNPHPQSLGQLRVSPLPQSQELQPASCSQVSDISREYNESSIGQNSRTAPSSGNSDHVPLTVAESNGERGKQLSEHNVHVPPESKDNFNLDHEQYPLANEVKETEQDQGNAVNNLEPLQQTECQDDKRHAEVAQPPEQSLHVNGVRQGAPKDAPTFSSSEADYMDGKQQSEAAPPYAKQPRDASAQPDPQADSRPEWHASSVAPTDHDSTVHPPSHISSANQPGPQGVTSVQYAPSQITPISSPGAPNWTSTETQKQQQIVRELYEPHAVQPTQGSVGQPMSEHPPGHSQLPPDPHQATLNTAVPSMQPQAQQPLRPIAQSSPASSSHRVAYSEQQNPSRDEAHESPRAGDSVLSRQDSSSFGSRDSIIANAAMSRLDLVQQRIPTTPVLDTVPEKSPTTKGKLKRLGKLHRISLGNAEQVLSDSTKKKTFARLSGLFGRSSTQAQQTKSNIPRDSTKQHVAQQTQQPPNLRYPASFQEPRGQYPGGFPVQQTHQSNGYPAAENSRAFLGQPPPPEGYYAPRQPSGSQSGSFIGGHRLSQQLISDAKLDFEGNAGLRSSYTRPVNQHPAQFQSQPPPQPQKQYQQQDQHQQRAFPTRHVSQPVYSSPPQGGTASPPYPVRREHPVLQRGRTHIRDLSIRSRSPRSHPPSSAEQNIPSSDYSDPAYHLGTFRSVPNTARTGDQERPWNITLPDDPEEKSRASHPAHWHTQQSIAPARFYQARQSHGYGEASSSTEARRFSFSPEPNSTSTSQNRIVPRSGHPHRDEAVVINKSESPVELPIRADDSSEEIVMSSTAYPGQEWKPAGYSHWEHY